MFEIKNGQISLNKTRKLTPKQLATLNNCKDEHTKNRYIMSLIGLTKSSVYIDRIKTGGVDYLISKRKNSIFTLMESMRQVNWDHKPTDKDKGQWIGVEIECIIPHQEGSGESCGDCDECADGNECMNGGNSWSSDDAHSWLKSKLKAKGVTRCCVKYDGSLSDDEGHGVEITILFNSKYGFEPLERLCKALKELGCYVNKTCGLHVHLDARHLTPSKVKRIGDSIGHALPVIQYVVSESRRTNSYCKLEVSSIRRNSDRYYAVNLTAYPKYKTIEIRLHQGSINATKIRNWIELLKFLGNAKLTQNIHTFEQLIDLGLSDELIEYCDKRVTELNPTAWSVLMPVEITPGVNVITGAA